MKLIYSLSSLITEKKIGELQDTVYINYVLQHTPSSKHGIFRKKRHEKEDGGERITDYHILELCKKAKTNITQYIVMGEIIDGVRFIVSSKEFPFLNIVINPQENSPFDWTLTVVTVMNKEDFNIGRNQLQIFI